MGRVVVAGAVNVDLTVVARDVTSRNPGGGYSGKPIPAGGKSIATASVFNYGDQIAAGLSRAVGEPVVYRPLSHDAYRDLGFPGADEAGNMLQYYTEFEDYFTGVRDLDAVRRLNPDLMTFDKWLDMNGHTIPTK